MIFNKQNSSISKFESEYLYSFIYLLLFIAKFNTIRSINLLVYSNLMDQSLNHKPH